MHVLYEKNWTALVQEPIKRFEENVIEEIVNGIHAKQIQSSLMKKNGQQWSFSSALLYAITILTTIGNSGLYTNTVSGKIVTIIYATVGIPLTFLCISNMGILLVNLLQCCMCSSSNHERDKYNYYTSNTCSPCYPSHQGQKRVKTEHSYNTQCGTSWGKKKHVVVRINENGKSCDATENIVVPCGDDEYVARRKCKQNGAVELNDLTLRYINSQNDILFESSSFGSSLLTCRSPKTPSRVPLLNDNKRMHTKYSSILPRRKSSMMSESGSIKISVLCIFSVLVAYICLGGAIFRTWKQVSFLAGMYACFSAIFTIDSRDMFWDNHASLNILQLVFYAAYIVTGLVIVSSTATVMYHNILNKKTVREIGR